MIPLRILSQRRQLAARLLRLGQAKDPQIRAAVTAPFTQATLNQIVNAASKASTPAANAPNNTQAAFDALVTLVETSREKGDDLLGAISEATP